jgi:hypothetical protein
MKDLLDLIVFNTPFAWIVMTITVLAITLMPRLFRVNALNGLLFAQITLFFNAIPIIAGLSTKAILYERGIHFFAIEFLFLALIYATYGRLLKRREQVFAALQRFFDGKATIPLIAFIALVALFNAFFTPTDGSSRIEYMTNAWFSLVKPFIQVALPLSYLGVFILLLNPKKRGLGYVLLVITVISNIMTGSKASFIFSLLSAFLSLRDLSISHSRLRIRSRDKLKLSVFVAAMVGLALTRLSVSPADVSDRFFLFGEATILTYFADQPTGACERVSTFASMHRGLARVAGDSSANDIDTLFGFALMIEATGVNTFTGPNARLSAYALCNFADERIVFCAIVLLVYLGLMLMVFSLASYRYGAVLAIVYPFSLVSLAAASQDFNLIMQDITLFFALLWLLVFILASTPRLSHA